MKPSFSAPVAGSVVAATLAWIVTPSMARADDEAVLQAREAQLRPGTLPAWETRAERMAPRRKAPPGAVPGAPAPLPPPTGYRVPAEFEPVAAFLVTEGDWQDDIWAQELDMLLSMIDEGTRPKGAGAIVLTRQDASSYESFLATRGVDLSRVRVLRHSPGLTLSH